MRSWTMTRFGSSSRTPAQESPVTSASGFSSGSCRVARGQDQRERIFERFVQGREGPGGAAGLGLAIVRDIVEAHGGRVHLESEVGRGSRFTMDLPRG
jgi:light-regulated signal transduction histidine kinase (bacteriophytochrome)